MLRPVIVKQLVDAGNPVVRQGISRGSLDDVDQAFEFSVLGAMV